jgi:hypothetical protein
MNETKVLGDIIRDQEYAAAREFIRRKYPLTELGATALMEFSLERNEHFRKIAEHAQEIVTAVVNTTVMPPLIVANFPRSSQNQTVASGVEGAHEGTTADESGSREPEKLNNAQDGGENMVNEVCAYCGKEVFHNGFNYEHVGGGAFCRNNDGKPRMVEPAKRCAEPEAIALYAAEEPEKEVPVALAESSLSHCPHFTDGRKKSDCGICDDASPELLPTQLEEEEPKP